MKPTYRLLFDAAEAVVAPFGATVEFKNGIKHAYLVVRFPDTFRKLTISHGTHTLKHQIDWVRQNARRALREMGKLDASAIEARSDAAPQSDAAEGESATAESGDAQ